MTQSTASAPIAEKRPFEITTHGHTRTDSYYWMREKTSDDVLAYISAENTYQESMTAHTKPLQDNLYAEMLGRIKETDDSVPVKDGAYYYYSRTVEGLQYSIHCRKKGSLEAAEEIVFDANLMADEHEYLVLGVLDITPNDQILAYGLDTTGAETYTIRFRNLLTGEELPDVIENAAGSALWGDDNTFFYTTEDEAKRADKLYRHKLGTKQADDEMLYHEPDALYDIYPYMTKDEKYIFVVSGAMETSESWFISAETSPTAQFQLFHPREVGIRYGVSHHADTFYITTNADGATNNQLMTTPVAATARDNWQTLIAYRPNVKLSGVELFATHMVIFERSDGLNHIRIMEHGGADDHYIEFPESVYTSYGSSNPEYTSSVFRFGYTSCITPYSSFDYDIATRERTLLKQQPVLGGYDASLYATNRITATAEDGTEIPITLVYRKDAWDGKTATNLHLYGYGSYGHTIDPTFSSNRISLLDRGIIHATAHVRGSQIFGREWYEDGKFLQKRNTFTDFIACAQHLISENYTTPAQMTAEGRSAGGLLMGAVLNMAPELFLGVIAGVPFVDVVTTMLDESIPLTVGEFDEWGNPKDKEYYDYMLSYSPYDNVEAKAYPHILVTAGLNDPRVQYWEPLKWVALLRDIKTDDNKLLLKMHTGAGHFSSSGRYDYLKDIAFDYAVLLDMHGITD